MSEKYIDNYIKVKYELPEEGSDEDLKAQFDPEWEDLQENK